MKIQTGITNRPPDHALFLGLTIIATEPGEARETVEALRGVVQKELQADVDETTPTLPKDQPSPETGELGFADRYNRYELTITTAFGKGAYDKLGVPVAERPQDLIPIPWLQLGDNPRRADNGDVLLQICSDSIYVIEHVQRRVEEELGERLQVVWVVAGAQRSQQPPGGAGQPRRRQSTDRLYRRHQQPQPSTLATGRQAGFR